METAGLTRVSEVEWRMEPSGRMRVPAVIFADQELIHAMDDKVLEQAANVATLPGIVKASYAMPDAHWGYGFPIGGVAGRPLGRGYGEPADLERIEERGRVRHARPEFVSAKAKERQRTEMGTLG